MSERLNRKLIAVVVAVVAMLLALAQPLWISATGQEVALAIEPIDPLSLFRGNYVDLQYDLDNMSAPGQESRYNEPAYVVFDTDARPARPLRVELSPPELAAGEVCIRGRSRGSRGVRLTDLEQYFVTREDGLRLERELRNMVAIVKTTNGCRAILVDIEPR